VDVELGRHDTEDGRLPALDVDLLSDQRGIAGERALPQLVRQDGDRLAVGQVLLLVEYPSAERRDADSLEQRSREADRGDPLRRVAFTEVHGRLAIRADLGERLRPLAQLEVFGR
jgi:hypothetical protein